MWAVHNLALTISAAHPCSNTRAVTFPIPHFVETRTRWGAFLLPPFVELRLLQQHTPALHVVLLALRKHSLVKGNAASRNGLLPSESLTPDELL